MIISACNAVKRVPEGKQLLVKNKLVVNGEKTKDDAIAAQLYQEPNSSIFGYKLRLNLYNLANPKLKIKSSAVMSTGTSKSTN